MRIAISYWHKTMVQAISQNIADSSKMMMQPFNFC